MSRPNPLTRLSHDELQQRIADLEADIADPFQVPRDREYRHPPFTEFPSLNDPDDEFEGDARLEELADLKAERDRRIAWDEFCAQRQPGDDDGFEYADPRDARRERRGGR